MKREELINRIKGRTYEPNDKLTLEIAYSDLWILIADELQAKELNDEETEAIEFIVDNPDCQKYWLANVKQFLNSEGEASDDSCDLSDEWQKQFEIAINILAKWARDR